MKYIVCLIPLFFTIAARSQSSLQDAVDQFTRNQQFTSAQVGVCVMDVSSGKIIAQSGAQQSLIPASSLKVVTTAAALQILGSDFRFRTELQYDGSIDANGTLRGNVYLKGFGDPSLATNDMDGTEDLAGLLAIWTKAIQEAGIRQIDGYIIGDASFYETAVNGRTWPWEDLGNYYASGAWGLNIHDNRYYLSFQQGSTLQQAPQITSIEPKIPGLQLINELQSAGKGTGDQAYIFGSPFNYTRFIRGTLPIGQGEMTIKGSIPDPPAFAAQVLETALLDAGIAVQRTAVSQLALAQVPSAQRPDLSLPRTILHTHYSPPLQQIIEAANQQSINLYCESILKMIGWKTAQQASTKGGISALFDFLNRQGIETKGLFLEDGSGLSPRNGISAQQLAQFMTTIAQQKDWYQSFSPTLPLAGKNGTLRRLFKNSPVAGQLRAKSGGMARVRSYTGWVPGPAGQLRAFCIIVNNFTGKSSQTRNEMVRLMSQLGQLK